MRGLFRRRVLTAFVAVLATAAAVTLPVSSASAAPSIQLLSPSEYRTPMIVSDENDANNAIHLVAWAGDVPPSPQVEFEVQQGLDQVTLTGVRGGTDSWSADFVVPATYTDGQIIIRAILYSGQTEVTRTPDEVVTLNSATPPPQSDSVEITHPENGAALGFFAPKDKPTNTVIRGIASEGTAQARVLYTTSAPGSDPQWKHCGGVAVSGGTFAARCTLVSGDSPGSVTAVAAVANRTPPPTEPNPAADETGDAHRVSPYDQVPTAIDMTPPSAQLTPGVCHVITATAIDQNSQAITGLNIDVHAQGPDDQLKFATMRFTNSSFEPPDKAHGGTELAAKCAATDDEARQGEHSVPVGDDIKHIESTAGTNNLGQFTFVLRSSSVGPTHVSAWGDADDDDTRGTTESSGTSRLGWGENPPPPQEDILVSPDSAAATVGECELLTIVVRADNNPVPGANVDVHIQNPTGVSFCSDSLRDPDAGGHADDSHSDGIRHGETETDGNGSVQFGVTSTTEGRTDVTVWLDKTDDDLLSGEPSSNASVTWQQVGDRSISLDANKRRVRKGSRVRLSGTITAAESCARDQVVKLLARRPGTRFRKIATKRSDAEGDYKFSVRVRKTKDYRTVTPANGVCDKAVSRKVRVRRR